MTKLALCCAAAALLVSCGSRAQQERVEAVRLCRFAARNHPGYITVATMANKAVTRTSHTLASVHAEDGAVVAARCESLARSLAEPLDAMKGFRQHLEKFELKASDNKALRAALVMQLAATERQLACIRQSVEEVERTAQAHPSERIGKLPAVAGLQQKVKEFRPAGDPISPLVRRLRLEHDISDAELQKTRPRPRRGYAVA